MKSFDTAFDAVSGKQAYCATGWSAEEVLMVTIEYLEKQATLSLSLGDRQRIFGLLENHGYYGNADPHEPGPE